ncbi:MAG: cytochrome c [Bdellovibrionaceae bacterium]|nr:cytochrome c [Pseudobdellovibrionaceae bacterium]
MKAILFQSALVITAVSFLSACHIDKSQPNFELIQDMMESPAIKPQEADPSTPNHISGREPVKGTAPVGFNVEPLDDLSVAEKEMKNPLAGDMSKDVLLTGQKYYQVHCALCHGSKGEGGVAAKSLIAEQMALKPPQITNEKVSGWSDVHLYYVISRGQGLMGPYANHVPQKYRWQLVNYIRHLQKTHKN